MMPKHRLRQTRDPRKSEAPPAFAGIVVAVRAEFPETAAATPWAQRVADYAAVGAVELAFHRIEPFLYSVSLRDVIGPLERNGVRVSSVHMAHARASEPEVFLAVLKKTVRVAQALDCRVVVAHPSWGALAEVEPFLAREADPLLKRAGVVLCWETFGGARRFLSGIEGIAAFCERHPWYGACYDTSHLHKPQSEVLEDIRRHAAVIRCFHLSNRLPGHGAASQHLPLRHPGAQLDFREIVPAIAKSAFAGSVTLEYLREYHGQLVEDALWVLRWLVEGERDR